MAGEWIKIESGTPNKPELMRAARILGVDRDLVLGKVARLWAWFDINSVDGHVDGVVSTDVDDVVGMDGFCNVMERVGWLDFDDEAEWVALPNFDRHNGETAKKRALKNKRQAKWRKNKAENVDGAASTDATTREEKRREEDNPLSTGADASDEQTTPMPDNWQPNESTIEQCRQAGCPEVTNDDVVMYRAHYADRWTSERRRQAWFIKWMVREKVHKAERQQSGGRNHGNNNSGGAAARASESMARLLEIAQGDE